MRETRPVLTSALAIIWMIYAPKAHAQYVYNQAVFPVASGNGYGVATADFNGDGILDLAVVTQAAGNSCCDGTLSILLGNPNGTFGAPTNYILQQYRSTQVLVADFNGDGKPDLAVLNQKQSETGQNSNSTVSVLLGSGDGTFQTPITSFFGSYGAKGMAARDFTGDGKTDLVAYVAGTTVEVLPGNGNGSFGLPISTQVIASAQGAENYTIYFLAAGDFRGNGTMDVAVSVYPGSDTVTTFVDVLLGNGNGTFQTPVPYNMQNFNYLQAVDVNHNGIPDLVGISDGIGVLLGNGDGTFQPEMDSASGGTSGLVIGDFNGDGNIDLAGPSGIINSNVSVLNTYLGDGTGNFRLVGAHSPLPNGGLEATGDFNGDGILDLAIAGQSDVYALLGNGDGTFGPTYQLGIILDPVSGAVADFTGNGNLDIAIGENYQTEDYADIQLGAGNGTFSAATPASLAESPTVTVAADFNNNNKPDLAILEAYPCNCIQVFTGNGEGGFTTGSKLTAKEGGYILLAEDFNNDGNIDLLVGAGSSPARLLLGNGNGTFQSPVGVINWSPNPTTNQMIAADFNNDGSMDVATSQGSTVNIFLGNGNGTFQSPLSFTPNAIYTAEGMAVADFNGDGKPDLAVGTGDGIAICLGNGNGTFQTCAVIEENVLIDQFDLVIAADVNGDGKPDLVAINKEFSFLYIFPGHGDGTFSPPLVFGLPPALDFGVTGDFNGDGTTDLGLASTSQFTVWNSAPFVAVGPHALNLGGVAVGNASGTQTVNVYNIGTAPLQVTSVAASGVFFQTNECGTLAVGASCAINVNFTPPSTGTFTGTLTIVDNSRGIVGSTQTVSMAGTGTLPLAGPLPSSLTFSNQEVGTVSTSQQVTLSNTGTGTLSISGISTSGDFNQSNNCGGGVAANNPCTINVTFTPTGTGTRNGTLTVIDNSNDQEGATQTVNLEGMGTAPLVGALPGTLTFSNQNVSTSSASQLVTLSNNGTAPLTVTSIATTGDFNQSNNCPANVQANSSCSISVIFTPTSTGTRNGTLTISDDNNAVGGSTQTVGLVGTGTMPATGFSPPSLSFGSSNLGAPGALQSLTLTDTGTGTLTVSTVTLGGTNVGDFTKTYDTCSGVTLEPNGNCSVGVRFTPAGIGNRAASLNFADNAANSPQSVDLGGTGLAPLAGLSAYTLDFLPQSTGATSVQSLTLTNSGNAALAISGITTRGYFTEASTCGASLSAGDNCKIAVTFRTLAIGTVYGTLTVMDNSFGGPQTVALSGTGVVFTSGPRPPVILPPSPTPQPGNSPAPPYPVVSLSSTSLTFPAQNAGASSTHSIKLTNAGTTALVISSITAAGDFSAATTCGSKVATGASCSLSITFTPTATGLRAGAVIITDNDNGLAGSTQVVDLSGIGEPPLHGRGPLPAPSRVPLVPITAQSRD